MDFDVPALVGGALRREPPELWGINGYEIRAIIIVMVVVVAAAVVVCCSAAGERLS